MRYSLVSEHKSEAIKSIEIYLVEQKYYSFHQISVNSILSSIYNGTNSKLGMKELTKTIEKICLSFCRGDFNASSIHN